MTTADNQPLGQALAENQAFLQTMFGGSSDFYTKSFTICGCRCCIAMFAGLSSPEKLCIMVLHALGQGVPGCKAGPQLVQYLAEQSCLPTEQNPITTRTQLVEALAGGMAVLLVEGSGQALAFSTQDMPGRSVTNPSGEGNMRGPQDAFTEHLRNNISQLRRQFRTGSFTAEICTANTRAKTEYAICYDTALAPADVVQTLKQRLAGVQIPVLLDSTYFASFLKQDKLNLFPAAAYTERPATACARICEGKIVILVSGSPLAMVVPSFFAEHFECLDDYSSGAVFAGLIRLLKYLAFLLAVFGPGLYVMAVSFAPELIPVHLLAKLAQGEASTPLPPMPEMLAVTLLLEIVREAGLRAPKSISHTVSLVGALIIGETAVSAGIISVPVLTMAAAATIATLAVPALYEQSILFRFAVILLAGLFGVPGLACGALLILAMACGSDPFGYDYLYPLMPPGKAALRDGFVRAIWSHLAQKGRCCRAMQRVMWILPRAAPQHSGRYAAAAAHRLLGAGRAAGSARQRGGAGRCASVSVDQLAGKRPAAKSSLCFAGNQFSIGNSAPARPVWQRVPRYTGAGGHLFCRAGTGHLPPREPALRQTANALLVFGAACMAIMVFSSRRAACTQPACGTADRAGLAGGVCFSAGAPAGISAVCPLASAARPALPQGSNICRVSTGL